jgi:hypothetical protein
LGEEDGQSGNKIETALMDTTDHGRKAIRAALKIGVREGQLGVDIGARNAKLYFCAEASTA